MTDRAYLPEMRDALAPWWKRLLAIWFGKRFVGYDSGFKCVGYSWRGKMYVVLIELDTMEDE